MMLPLIPIALSLLPDLARWLVGPKAGEVASTVSATVASVIGSDDPAVVAAAMSDPAKAADLRIRLAEIAAQADASQQQARLDEMKTALADVASARQQTIALAQAGSAIAWGVPIISIVVTVGFFGTLIVVLANSSTEWPPGVAAVLNVMLGVLGTAFTGVCQYWTGSSAGSARKDVMMAHLPAIPSITTPSLPPPPQAPLSTEDLNAREISRIKSK